MVEIDLDKGEVVGTLEPKSEFPAVIKPVKPSLPPPPPMEELIDILKTNHKAKEHFDRGARLTGTAIAGKANAEEAALVLELGNEKQIAKIGLIKEEVTKVEPVGEIEGSRLHIYQIYDEAGSLS